MRFSIAEFGTNSKFMYIWYKMYTIRDRQTRKKKPSNEISSEKKKFIVIFSGYVSTFTTTVVIDEQKRAWLQLHKSK